MNIGTVFGRQLKRFGVRHIAMLSGGHTQILVRGCAEEGIGVIDVRDEATAGFFAFATSALTGIPGVAIVTAGPGLTNVLTPIVAARQAGVPMVVIIGASPSAWFIKGKGSLQETDQIGLVTGGGSVKWAKTLKRVRDLPGLLHEAFYEAMSGVPGPVVLECPVDVLYDASYPAVRAEHEKFFTACGTGIRGAIARYLVKRTIAEMHYLPDDLGEPLDLPAPRPAACPAGTLDRIARLLGESDRPALVVGTQIMWSAFCPVFGQIVSKLGIPTYLAGLARGSLGKNHAFEYHLSRKAALREADLVILVGMPPDFRLNYGLAINPKAKLVRIDLDPDYLKGNRRPAASARGDVGEILIKVERRNDAFAFRRLGWEGWRLKLKELEGEEQAKIAAGALAKTDRGVNPLALLQLVKQRIEDSDRESIIVVDGGDFVGSAARIIRAQGPGGWLDSGPFGALGSGAGFALAAKAARPDADVWVIWGDGAFGWSLIEMDTSARHKLPFIGIIGNDYGWTQIMRGDREMFQTDKVIATRLSPVAMYGAASRALGGFGMQAFFLDDVRRALDAAVKGVRDRVRPNSAIIDVAIGETDLRKGSISV